MSCELVGYIPAGGLGERLRPLTSSFPKPLLLMGDKANRVIDFPVSSVRKVASRILVATGYCHERFNMHFDRSDDSLIILRDKMLLNVGGSLLQHYRLISEPGLLGDNILMIPGDHVVESVDFGEMHAIHAENKADITIGLVEKRDYGNYVCLDGLGRVVEMGEKGDYSYTGICIIRSVFLLDRLNDAIRAGWDNTTFDFGKGVVVPAIGRFHVRGYCFKGDYYWDDVGTIDRYYLNNMRLSRGDNIISVSAEVADKSQITRSVVLDGARVGRVGKIREAIIPPGGVVNCVADCVFVRRKIN